LAVHCFALLLGGHRPYTGTWRAAGDAPAPRGPAASPCGRARGVCLADASGGHPGRTTFRCHEACQYGNP
ncbi:hypothetical protein, partial [Frankia sp. AgB1.8]|uniref:hypothetical protein n=1 Tax=Frankia sp. AgB1.8 TaxID=2792839 RepID=UPI001EE429F2